METSRTDSELSTNERASRSKEGRGKLAQEVKLNTAQVASDRPVAATERKDCEPPHGSPPLSRQSKLAWSHARTIQFRASAGEYHVHRQYPVLIDCQPRSIYGRRDGAVGGARGTSRVHFGSVDWGTAKGKYTYPTVKRRPPGLACVSLSGICKLTRTACFGWIGAGATPGFDVGLSHPTCSQE